jgi:hypothetical protein
MVASRKYARLRNQVLKKMIGGKGALRMGRRERGRERDVGGEGEERIRVCKEGGPRSCDALSLRRGASLNFASLCFPDIFLKVDFSADQT